MRGSPIEPCVDTRLQGQNGVVTHRHQLTHFQREAAWFSKVVSTQLALVGPVVAGSLRRGVVPEIDGAPAGLALGHPVHSVVNARERPGKFPAQEPTAVVAAQESAVARCRRSAPGSSRAGARRRSRSVSPSAEPQDRTTAVLPRKVRRLWRGEFPEAAASSRNPVDGRVHRSNWSVTPRGVAAPLVRDWSGGNFLECQTVTRRTQLITAGTYRVGLPGAQRSLQAADFRL